jgi:hypothetical protein
MIQAASPTKVTLANASSYILNNSIAKSAATVAFRTSLTASAPKMATRIDNIIAQNTLTGSLTEAMILRMQQGKREVQNGSPDRRMLKLARFKLQTEESPFSPLSNVIVSAAIFLP